MTKNFKKIFEISKKIDFDIDFESGNDIITVFKKHGTYLFEFLVKYSKETKNYISANYLNPEEATLIFEVEDVDDLIIYDYKNRIIDFDDNENEKILKVLKNKLIGITREF